MTPISALPTIGSLPLAEERRYQRQRSLRNERRVMLILNAILVMAFVFMVAILLKDVVDAHGLD
jgi:hypothetical protein